MQSVKLILSMLCSTIELRFTHKLVSFIKKYQTILFLIFCDPGFLFGQVGERAFLLDPFETL